MKNKLIHFLVIILCSFFVFIMVVFSGISEWLYKYYEGYFLYGHYVGETKAGYYLDFLKNIVLPCCIVAVGGGWWGCRYILNKRKVRNKSR